MKETKGWTKIPSKDIIKNRKGNEVSKYVIHIKENHLLLNLKYINDKGKVKSICKRYQLVNESESISPVKDLVNGDVNVN